MPPIDTRLTLLIVALCCACSSGSAAGGTSLAGTGSGVDSDAATGDVGCTNETGLDVYTPGLHKSGASGRYDFKLLSSAPSPPALGDDTFVVQVSVEGGRGLNGELGVTLDMPDHGYQSPKQPNIVYDAARRAFTLAPMDLFMVGLWRFTFASSRTSPTATRQVQPVRSRRIRPFSSSVSSERAR